jgi:hypothetical protein
MNAATASQTIVVSSGGIPQATTSITLSTVPLEILKKYSSRKPIRRRVRRKEPK